MIEKFGVLCMVDLEGIAVDLVLVLLHSLAVLLTLHSVFRAKP